MLKSLSIEKFRGFKDLKVEGMDRFNLFFGRNNAGKTALLESLFLLAGPQNPGLTISLIGFRGIEQFRFDAEDLWGWLFYQRKLGSTVTLKAKLTSNAERTLTLTLAEPKQLSVKSTAKSKSTQKRMMATATTASHASDLLMTLEHESGARGRTRAVLKEGAIAIEVEGKKIKMPTGVYISSRGGYASENAERFSRLEEVGKEGVMLPSLQVLEPRLKRLAVLYSAAGPMIHADIGFSHMVPVPFLGEGIGRLMTVLLSIVYAKDGVVIIDEIDNGLHYSVLKNVWSSILALARELDVQLFATTHSWECLKAAHEAFGESTPYDFRLHRLASADGEIAVTSYDKEKIETAISHGLELR